jgi:hypothetical protein
MGMISLALAAAEKSEGDGDGTPGVADTSVPPALEETLPASPLSIGEVLLKGAIEGAIGDILAIGGILLQGELARLLISRSSSFCDELGSGAAAAAPAVLDVESSAVSRAPPVS